MLDSTRLPIDRKCTLSRRTFIADTLGAASSVRLRSG
jgi:hypothetical protein